MIVQRKLPLSTQGFNDIIDITPTLQQFVQETKLSIGSVLVFVAGATAGVTTIEYEP
jgi:thiamine phosphate synthase YjbQ (UPF0047 family)